MKDGLDNFVTKNPNISRDVNHTLLVFRNYNSPRLKKLGINVTPELKKFVFTTFSFETIAVCNDITHSLKLNLVVLLIVATFRMVDYVLTNDITREVATFSKGKQVMLVHLTTLHNVTTVMEVRSFHVRIDVPNADVFSKRNHLIVVFKQPTFTVIFVNVLVVLLIFSNSNKRTLKDTSTVHITTVNHVLHNVTIAKFDELVRDNLRHLLSLLRSFLLNQHIKLFRGNLLVSFLLIELNDSLFTLVTHLRQGSGSNFPVLVPISRKQ